MLSGVYVVLLAGLSVVLGGEHIVTTRCLGGVVFDGAGRGEFMAWNSPPDMWKRGTPDRSPHAAQISVSGEIAGGRQGE